MCGSAKPGTEMLRFPFAAPSLRSGQGSGLRLTQHDNPMPKLEWCISSSLSLDKLGTHNAHPQAILCPETALSVIGHGRDRDKRRYIRLAHQAVESSYIDINNLL